MTGRRDALTFPPYNRRAGTDIDGAKLELFIVIWLFGMISAYIFERIFINRYNTLIKNAVKDGK
jgi:hypothetical protein